MRASLCAYVFVCVCVCDAVSYVLGVYIIRESHTGEYQPGEYLSFFFARRGFHLRDTRVASLPLPAACCTLPFVRSHAKKSPNRLTRTSTWTATTAPLRFRSRHMRHTMPGARRSNS